MTTHIQQQEHYGAQSAGLPRPSSIAAISGSILAGVLLISSLPLLAAGGLWLLGMALTLIAYTFVANRQAESAAWDTAIVGQGLGLFGLALLFIASLLA